ncbi:MAG: penicillin-binding transpeptidase domain-containing protein [Lachnospiraceae bacterium]|nr:penicillin-binding transpeptidase domain-containing protein [Lachnospiraceae bacterium]
METYLERILEFIKSRLFVLLVTAVFLFIVLVVRLYNLQILEGALHNQELTASISRTLSLPASRGNIYDAYGRPLAVNEPTFSVKIDSSIKIDLKNKNSMLYNIVSRLSQNGELSKDSLPISSAPYEFTFTGETAQADEKKFKTKIGLSKKELKMTAPEVMAYLEEKFEIPEGTPENIKRNIIYLGLYQDNQNIMLLSLINLLNENKETITDELPLTTSSPLAFSFGENTNREASWKKEIGINEEKEGYTSALESYKFLIDKFNIPDNLSYDIQRSLASLDYLIYTGRFKKYQPLTVSLNISDETVASLEEKQSDYPGVIIDTDSLRKYPEGEYFSHIVGYIRKISDTEYEELKDYKDENGNQLYSISDIVGKSGIEKVAELELNGVDGEMQVEVDSLGTRISYTQTKESISGSDIYLTLDRDLQEFCFNTLEKTLKDIIIYKMTSAKEEEYPISISEFFSSMVNNGGISSSKIYNSKGGVQLEIKEYMDGKINFSADSENFKSLYKAALMNEIEKGNIAYGKLILVLYEQGKITLDGYDLESIPHFSEKACSNLMIEKLESGEIRPMDTGLDPCTGSVVVSDINTGDILSMVTYPSYDTNEFVNNFNTEYYNSIQEQTVTTPFINRPIYEKKAPGSTLKMVTAVAALETGVITPSTRILDKGTFMEAGTPYPKCWIGNGYGSHGNINVSEAIEVSCNYFFYEAAYRMNHGKANSFEAISTLNDYMAAFGLNSLSGIELTEERKPDMATPSYKESSIKAINPNATETQTRWTDGDTVRAAIGQSVNNYAPIHMNRYVATLANGGTLYKMHVINAIKDSLTGNLSYTKTEKENILEISQSTLDAVYSGMYKVTTGESGTLRNIFADFPVHVAAKSGTAQENLERSSHTWFVGFAPYENPQISVTVMIPFAEVSGSPAAKIAKEIIAEYMGLNYKPENTYLKTTLTK